MVRAEQGEEIPRQVITLGLPEPPAPAAGVEERMEQVAPEDKAPRETVLPRVPDGALALARAAAAAACKEIRQALEALAATMAAAAAAEKTAAARAAAASLSFLTRHLQMPRRLLTPLPLTARR